MLRKLSTLILCLVAAVATASAQTPPDNEIWYTTTDGSKIHINTNNLVSNNYYNGRGILKFRDRVTSIGDGAFGGCSSLKSITIPDVVTEIGEYAFADCSSLTSITIPESVTYIGGYAFYRCSSLTSITIPNSVTSIEYSTFKDCRSLKSITIPNSVTSIGHDAFEGCSSLTSITIPESVTSIGEDAFYGCSSLKSITIPESVTSIGDWTFSGCSSLKSVKVSNKYGYDYLKKLGVSDITFMISTLEEYEEAQKLGVTKIVIDSKYASEDGLCLIDKGELILFIGKDLTEYTIPESVTSIGEEAFYDCSSLKSVKVSNKYCYDYFKEKVTDIAFYGANATADGRCLIINGELQRFIGKGVTEYSIPEGVTSFRKEAFYGCSNLTSITIPESVTSIGEDAFYGCSSLKSITCLATTPPAISYISSEKTTLIYIPKKAVKAYKKDPKWSIYKKQIKPIK